METKVYNNRIDFIKGITMILVVLGHSVQYGSGTEYSYFDDVVFKFIYSFHMPLLMIISGYLFYFTLNRYSLVQGIRRRVTTLIVPVACWTLVSVVRSVVAAALQGGHYVNSCRELITKYSEAFIKNYWFLWAVFFCSVVVLLVEKAMVAVQPHAEGMTSLYPAIIVYGLIFITAFFLPDDYHICMYSFMYPFFVAGYYINKLKLLSRDDVNKVINSRIFFACSIGVYAVLLYFFNWYTYIYNTGYSLLGKDFIFFQFRMDMLRMLTGFVGSLVIVLLIDRVYKYVGESVEKAVCSLGRKSISIYILSIMIQPSLLPAVTRELPRINYLYTILETVSIILICLIIDGIISLCPPVYNVLFGGRYVVQDK